MLKPWLSLNFSDAVKILTIIYEIVKMGEEYRKRSKIYEIVKSSL